jgi:cob(I)alamin adenosyltransferase
VAALGLARALSDAPPVRGLILRLQRELFVAGADLATNPEKRDRLEPGVSRVTGDMIDDLESLIDERVAEQPLADYFVVPGASPVSAALDLARVIVRRAERRAVAMREAGGLVSDEALRYLNRLSDLLFVLARWQAGGPEEPSRDR